MPFEWQYLATMILSVAAGVVVTGFVLRNRSETRFEAGRAELMPDVERLTIEVAEKAQAIRSMEARVASLATGLQRKEAEHQERGKQLAVAEHKNRELPLLKEDIAEHHRHRQQLQDELKTCAAGLAREKERARRLEAVTGTLLERERAIDGLRTQLSEKEVTIRELSTRMDEERKQAEEKLALLNGAKAELTDQFRVLAQEILDQKGKAFGEQSQTGLKVLLDPFRDQLNAFKQKVDDVYVNEAKERASLKKEIETLRDLNRRINQEAINLTRALKGDKKAQGTWGELILERVLEQSGLRKGIEYETQGAFRDADGKLLRPDVVVHLPEEKDVVVDSKVSLLAYERYAGAEAEEERATALAEHISAVRAHIDGLSGKDYAGLSGVRSLDFVLMFMPIEAAFVAAFREDETLYAYAFERRIVVVTPSTLLATLKTIENIWRYERQNKSAQAVFERASAIYDKLRLFVESMEKLGKQMDTARTTFDEAMNRLVRGKGNVISQAARLPALGISVKKKIPRTVTDMADMDPLAPTEESALPPEQEPLFGKTE
jgi:DNA recombination protein RmuC